MRIITAEQIAEHCNHTDFIEALRFGFSSGIIAPVRHVHEIERTDQANSLMLLMPAWTDFAAQGDSTRGYSGVKIINFSPDNAKTGQSQCAGDLSVE